MKCDKDLIQNFLFFLYSEKGLSQNTITSYKFDLTDFINYTESIKINLQQIQSLNILQYFEHLANEKSIEASSQLRKISVLFNFYEFLIKEKGFTFNPIREVERPQKGYQLPIFLEPDEISLLLQTAQKDKSNKGIRDYAILCMLYSSGMRISECLEIKISEVINKKGAVNSSCIINGKGNKERIIFLNNVTKEAIKSYLKIRSFFPLSQNPFLFNAKTKNGFLARQNFFYSIKKIAQKSGIEKNIVSPHKIRHSFATHMFSNGIDVRILQEMLGHSDISTTQIYTHINSSMLKKVVENFHPFGKKDC